MQTFLPYANFAKSAACLDNRRLGKQRVECLQIMKALTDSSYGWQNHPAVKMWRPWPCTLYEYSIAICNEWIRRGFDDTCKQKLFDLHYRSERKTHIVSEIQDRDEMSTAWLGDEAFHASHRSNLLRKDPKHYGQFGWSESSDLPYVWPGGMK